MKVIANTLFDSHGTDGTTRYRLRFGKEDGDRMETAEIIRLWAIRCDCWNPATGELSVKILSTTKTSEGEIVILDDADRGGHLTILQLVDHNPDDEL